MEFDTGSFDQGRPLRSWHVYTSFISGFDTEQLVPAPAHGVVYIIRELTVTMYTHASDTEFVLGLAGSIYYDWVPQTSTRQTLRIEGIYLPLTVTIPFYVTNVGSGGGYAVAGIEVQTAKYLS